MSNKDQKDQTDKCHNQTEKQLDLIHVHKWNKIDYDTRTTDGIFLPTYYSCSCGANC